MDRQQAEQILSATFGIPRFYDEQWEDIRRLMRGERVLMIQRTGFGKSLCYQFPASQFPGVTIVFSPLIALMRDQVKALKARGIAAALINCEQTREENAAAMRQAIEGQLKILYIAPERQENEDWLAATRQMNISMIVVDEAHTISTWGHDFRPAFRRIINLVNQMPRHLPVMAATATATKMVERDIQAQISGELTTLRGSLARDNFRLYVVRVNSNEEKMLWLAQYVQSLPGTGLIYTGTRAESEFYSRWLQHLGIEATEYHAGLDADSRKDIEDGLMSNRWKCIASTNALGMGLDKPDIRFVIHTQIPQSPVHYYQEIGRAGRDGLPTNIVLLYNDADVKLPKSFIDNARPAATKYHKAIALLKEEPLSERELVKKANLKLNQIRIIKADLISQGIIKEVKYGSGKKYEYQFNAPELDTSEFERLRQMRLDDLDRMVQYVYAQSPRMAYLCNIFDPDADYSHYHNCDNTGLAPCPVKEVTASLATKLQGFRESFFPELDTEAKGRAPKSRMLNGVAASWYGDSAVGATLHRCKYEGGGDFPDHLVGRMIKAFYAKFRGLRFDYVMYVPPSRSGNLVRNFAEKFASAIGIPISHGLVKTRQTEEQKIFQNSFGKHENVAGAFAYVGNEPLHDAHILLIDDIYDSGATVKEIGRMLTALGAASITPLVIAKTLGGTL